jgi:hypothetical protein
LKKLLFYIKNKYLIASLAFIAWLIFFDRNDFITQYNTRQKLHKLEQAKQYYLDEIAKNKADTLDLSKNREKFGREKYLMKKDNEDVFVIIKEKKK